MSKLTRVDAISRSIADAAALAHWFKEQLQEERATRMSQNPMPVRWRTLVGVGSAGQRADEVATDVWPPDGTAKD
jgi:hypothetical protein